jgi:KH domain
MILPSIIRWILFYFYIISFHCFIFTFPQNDFIYVFFFGLFDLQERFGKSEQDLIPLSDILAPPVSAHLLSPTQPPATSFEAAELVKNSGKYAGATKVTGKNFLKDEVVIRNSDSGKVMGIKGRRVHMIEELSETIISFERVNPGAKERLVQITGPNEDNIEHARKLIEETIRRNASPDRPVSTLGEESGSDKRPATPISQLAGEYKYTVNVGLTPIKITGADPKLVSVAKLVLDEYFSKNKWQRKGSEDVELLSDSENAGQEEKPLPLTPITSVAPVEEVKVVPVVEIPKPGRLVYTREFLLQCSKSPLSQGSLPNWANIARQNISIVRKVRLEQDYTRLPSPNCRPVCLQVDTPEKSELQQSSSGSAIGPVEGAAGEEEEKVEDPEVPAPLIEQVEPVVEEIALVALPPKTAEEMEMQGEWEH